MCFKHQIRLRVLRQHLGFLRIFTDTLKSKVHLVIHVRTWKDNYIYIQCIRFVHTNLTKTWKHARHHSDLPSAASYQLNTAEFTRSTNHFQIKGVSEQITA